PKRGGDGRQPAARLPGGRAPRRRTGVPGGGEQHARKGERRAEPRGGASPHPQRAAEGGNRDQGALRHSLGVNATGRTVNGNNNMGGNRRSGLLRGEELTPLRTGARTWVGFP
ncbi:hypothetical protein DQ04_06261060, partial [Trypanosoma grayi]|uniref:hypothetical protein n=1 Tax=Trypanosoma grayi TaxID=71804 RepID=UPI0004F445BC